MSIARTRCLTVLVAVGLLGASLTALGQGKKLTTTEAKDQERLADLNEPARLTRACWRPHPFWRFAFGDERSCSFAQGLSVS